MALRFDASGDVLSRTTNLPTITTWTIMAWVQIAVDRNDYSCFWHLGWSTSQTQYFVGTAADGTTFCLFGGTEVNGSALAVGTWYHLAATVAGTGAGQFLGYLNGALNITANGVTATAQTLQFGNDPVSEFVNGRLAAIKVYGAVLTAAEIANEMLTYLPQRWTNLNTWLPCVDGTVANNALDLSGAGANMTVGGTLTVEDGPPIAWGMTPAWPWGRSSAGTPPAATSRPPRLHPWRFYRRVA